MAKNGKTKTDEIRAAIRGGVDSPTEIAKKLNAKGVKVTAAYVSTIKATDKRKAQSGQPARKPGRPVGSTRRSSHRPDVSAASELMLDAIDLVVRLGAQEAKQVIDTAEAIVNRAR